MADAVPVIVLDARDGDQVTAEVIGSLPAALSDRSASNPAVVLAEATGYQYDKLAYALNRWPDTVVTKALNLVGVTVEPAAAATVQQSFTLSAPQSTDTTIEAGSQVSIEDGSIVFETTDDLAISAYTTPAGTITFTAGSTAVTGSGTAFVTGSTWVGYQIGLRGGSGQDPSTWYTIASVTNGTNLVITANAAATASGAWAVGPITGTVAAQATTTGSDTNVGAGKLITLVSSLPKVSSTTNAADATGGQDAETTDEAIARAPTEFAARDIACTEEDFAYFARKILGHGGRAIARANMNVTTAATGYVTVACLSPTWTAATPCTTAERAAVVRDLNLRKFTSATLVDVAATVTSVVPAVAIYKQANYSDAQVKVNVAAALNTYLSPNTYTFGRIIYLADLVDVVESAAGVDRVHSISSIPACGTAYATSPATLAFVNGNATANTADTTGLVANTTYVVDSSNAAVYLVTAVVANTSVTFDRVWGGSTATVTAPYFRSRDDDMNGGTTSPTWSELPYANLSVDTDAAPAQVVVIGSV